MICIQIMDHSEKPEFARLCRELRVNHQPYLKQRQVAEALGVAVSTYGNLESSRFMVVGRASAERLAKFYRLDPGSAGNLIRAWERLPLSPHGEKRRKIFARRASQRSKAKHHDVLMVSLCEVLGAVLPMLPPDQICACDITSTCEVCTALEHLGLEPFTTPEVVIEQLAKLGDQLEAKAAAGAAP
jgi:transcriptional regulator with XRE-family HTH domain